VTPVLDLHDVTMRYDTRGGDGVTALQGVTVKVAEGEFVALVGPSGCGKSTLLRIAAGLLRATAGRVEVDGVRHERPHDDLGLMFQTAVLLPWRTVLANVALPAVLKGARLDAVRPRAMELIDLVGLTGFEDRYPHELSGGMQQRVSLARALMQDPRVLLLDEPFGALDAMTRDQLNVEVERVRAATGKTILLVTHSIPEAVFLSDRIVVLSRRPGQVKAVVDVVLPRPRDLAVLGDPRFAVIAAEVRGLLDGQSGGTADGAA
jgi:NitT/TauT family transport system ATP-binding protein